MRGLLTSRRSVSLAIAVLLTSSCAGRSERNAGDASSRDPIEVTARVDPAVGTVGDRIRYEIEVAHLPEVTPELPDPCASVEEMVEEMGEGLTVLEGGESAPEEVGERRRTVKWCGVRADRVGSYIFPPLEVGWTVRPDANAGVEPPDGGRLSTAELFVEIRSVLGDGEAADIRDIKPLRPPEWRAVWLDVLLGATVAFAIWLAWLLRRRMAGEVALPRTPAHEPVLAEIERLAARSRAELDVFQATCFGLSEVVRGWVETRFGLNATDLTTEEIVARLGDLRGLDSRVALELRRFLDATDMVKYARRMPSASEAEAVFERARDVVEATIERPAEETSDSPLGEVGEAPA